MGNNLKFFKDYVSKYNQSDSRIKLKINHTYRTMSFASLLAQYLKLNEKEINKAETIALFHDIGRFDQIIKYGTFNDYKSIDHGDLGEEILKNNGYTDEVILNAVKYHNKYDIPNDLTKEEIFYAKIIRDADKIDNLNMTYEGDNDFIYISEDIIDYYKAKQMIPKNITKNRIDSQLCILSYIFDINFKESFEIIDNLNVVDKMIESLFYQTHDDVLFDIKDILNKYIEKRIKGKGRVKKNVR